MYIYCINNITKEVIAKTTNVIAFYDGELIFKNQKSAKEFSNNLSKSIEKDLNSGIINQITYAADLAECIVIPQKNIITVICDNINDSYEKNYNAYINK